MSSNLLLLFQYSLETVDKILVIFVTIKHIKAWKNELILLLNKFVQEINILLLVEMIACQAIQKLEQLLFVLWNRWNWSLHVASKLLS